MKQSTFKAKLSTMR